MTGLVGKSFFKDLILFVAVFIVFNLLETKDVWAASQIIAEVKEKAANVIEHYKPIVYILGGFGLVCVAWGAIFGKMNWKWFANLAIGLFLVAWMGKLIDYFTRDPGVGSAQKAFKTTTMSSRGGEFGDTLTKKASPSSGGFANTYIKGMDDIAQTYFATAEIDGNYYGDSRSTLVSGEAFMVKGPNGGLVDIKKYLAAGSTWEKAAANAKDDEKNIYAARAGSTWEKAAKNAKDDEKGLYAALAGSKLVSGSIKTKIVDASGQTVDGEYLAQGDVSSDWSEVHSEEWGDLAYTASNLQNGSFTVTGAEGEQSYLAGGNAITNFSYGFAEGIGEFGDRGSEELSYYSADNMYTGAGGGYMGNSNYVQFEIADMTEGDAMFDVETQKMGTDIDDFSGLNTESRKGKTLQDRYAATLNRGSALATGGTYMVDIIDDDFNKVGEVNYKDIADSGGNLKDGSIDDMTFGDVVSNMVDGEITYTDKSGEHTDSADGNVHTTLAGANENYDYRGDTGGDWEEAGAAYAASKLKDGTFTYTDASGEHTESSDGDVKTTMASSNTELDYQGDVKTNMNSSDGYKNVNTNMNSAAGYQNVNTNMNSAAGYKDVKTNMNSPAGYRDVKTNLNSPAGYKDEETHWGR